MEIIVKEKTDDNSKDTDIELNNSSFDESTQFWNSSYTKKKNELIMDKGGYNIIRKTFYYIVWFPILIRNFSSRDNLPLFIKNNKGLLPGYFFFFLPFLLRGY